MPWVGFYTLIRRETHRFITIWPQTLLQPLVTSILYLVVFGNLLGPYIFRTSHFDYLQYIASGLIIIPLITDSYINTVTSFFTMKLQRTLQELLISPLPLSLIIIGFALGGVIRGMVAGIIVGIMCRFFTYLTISHLFNMLICGFLITFLFSLLGILNALCAKKFEHIYLIQTFFLVPATYLSGIFYPISKLSHFWASLALYNPIYYLVNSFRHSLFPSPKENNFIFSLSYTLLAILITFLLNYYFLLKVKRI